MTTRDTNAISVDYIIDDASRYESMSLNYFKKYASRYDLNVVKLRYRLRLALILQDDGNVVKLQ